MIASMMMRTSVVLLLVGIVLGIVMGIRQDFLLAPAHAHLNLVGGVMLFMFGLYYRLQPDAARTTLAKAQGWLHIAGGILLPAGIAVVLLSGHSASMEIAPVPGSLIMLAAMALFVVVVFQNTRSHLS